jgi:hypothetical protein
MITDQIRHRRYVFYTQQEVEINKYKTFKLLFDFLVSNLPGTIVPLFFLL